MDGVLFKDTNFWMKLHEVFDTLEDGKKLTKKYLYTDYNMLVKEVVGRLWKGRNADPYFKLVNDYQYLPGVKEVFDFIKQHNLITAIVSGGNIDVARRVQHDYGVDHIYANGLVVENNIVTGEFIWPVAHGREKKAEIIQHLAKDLNISLQEVVYIGDSETDIEAFKEVGLAIAFNTDCEELKEVANHVVEGNNLKEIVPLFEK